MQRTPLEPDHVEALRREGRVVEYPTGVYLARPGQPIDRFTYVEEGEIEVVDPFTEQRRSARATGPTQFMGEIGFLNGGTSSAARPARRAGTRTTWASRPASPAAT